MASEHFQDNNCQGTAHPRLDVKKVGIAACLIFSITFFIYFPATGNDFVDLDDYHYVVLNKNIQNLNWDTAQWMLTSFHASNWHPLTWLSHAVDVSLFGLDPHLHHLTNILLHAVNTLLVFILVIGLLGRMRGEHLRSRAANGAHFRLVAGIVAALLFGLHPIHVESVAWISERKDLLCALFVLMSLLFYLRYTDPHGGGQKAIWFVSAICFYAMALMSKPMAVTLPAILILLDVYPLNRLRPQFRKNIPILAEKIPFLLFSLVSGVLTLAAQRAGGTIAELEHHGLLERLANAVRSVVFYLQKMILPDPLVPFYPFPIPFDPLNDVYIFSAICVLVVTSLCLWAWTRGQRAWVILWAAYVIPLLPVIGIIQVGSQSAADRYAYLPSISPFLLCGLGAGWISLYLLSRDYRRLFQGAALLCFVLLISLLSLQTTKQIRVWKDGEVLMQHIIGHFPERAVLAHNNLAVIYSERDMTNKAISHYQKALEIEPGNALILTNLGKSYAKKGLHDEAIAAFHKALVLDPGYKEAHVLLGDVYLTQDQKDKAIEAYRRGLDGNPGFARGHYSLGVVYFSSGRPGEAMAEFKAAVKHKPGYSGAYYYLGVLYTQQGEMDSAIKAFRKGIRLDPGNAQLHNNLAIVYAQKKMYQESVKAFRKALSLETMDPAIWYNLSRVLYLQEDLTSAYRHAMKAAELGFDVPEDYLNLLSGQGEQEARP